MTQFVKSNRKFTLALRTCDAINVTSQTSAPSTSTWPNIRWQDLIPADIAPNATWLCTHTFEEQMTMPFPRDLGNTNRRSFALTTNLSARSLLSNVTSNTASQNNVSGYNYINYNNTNPPTPDIPPAPGNFTPGFLNTMEEEDMFPLNTFLLAGSQTGISNAYTGNINALWAKGRYKSRPHTFEVFSPGLHKDLRISYTEIGIPLTYLDITASSGFYYNPPNPGTSKILRATGAGTSNILPQFYTLAFFSSGVNIVQPLSVPLGVHIFEFELIYRDQDPQA
jgi:hypothetical protein